MPNVNRKRSDFTYNILEEQIDALIELAQAKNQAVEDLILIAIDQYIDNEKQHHAGKSN